MAKLKHILKKAAKYIPALIGAVGGTMIGGPAGGMVGSSLGGTLARGRKNKLKGALEGAGVGGLYVAGAPMLYQALGGQGGGLLSKMTGYGGPSLLHQLGMSRAPSMGGGIGVFGNAGQRGAFHHLFGNKTLGERAFDVIGNASSRMSKRGRSLEPEGYYQQYSQPHQFESSPLSVHQGSPYEAESPYDSEVSTNKDVRTILSSPGSSALDKLLQLLQILEGDDRSTRQRNMGNPQQPAQFKYGGYVDGDSGGQDDDVPTDIPEGSYVMDATTVSLLGDGSSKNGAKKLKQLEDSFSKSGITRDIDRSYRVRSIDAKVSPGEYIVDKKTVDNIGKGDNNKGAKVFDKFRNDLRKDKGVKKFLPPKSKPIHHYVSKGRVR